MLTQAPVRPDGIDATRGVRQSWNDLHQAWITSKKGRPRWHEAMSADGRCPMEPDFTDQFSSMSTT